jgi:hypothetical protein
MTVQYLLTALFFLVSKLSSLNERCLDPLVPSRYASVELQRQIGYEDGFPLSLEDHHLTEFIH